MISRESKTAVPERAPERNRKWLGALPAAGYLALALLFTWPLPLRMADGIILFSGSDAWLHLWDLWWARFSLLDLHTNPYFTNYLYHPSGLPLTYHSLDILNGLLSIPLQPLGLLFSFNILLLLNLVLTGLAAYWLLRLLGASRAAAFIGGAIFLLCPINSTSVNLAQMDEVMMVWIPLYLGLLLKAGGLGVVGLRPSKPLFAVAAGLALAGSALATWYFTAGLVLLTGVYALWETIWRLRQREVPWWRPILLSTGAGLVFVTVLSPLLAAMVSQRLAGGSWMLPSPGTTIYNSADLLAFFVPLPARLDWSGLYPHGSNVAIGWSALALALLGVALAGRGGRARFALPLLAGMVLVVFALGPELKVAGIETRLPAPYALLNSVPFIGASRQPLRYSATTELCFAIAAAWGLDLLLKRLTLPRARTVLLAATALIVLLEYVPAGRTMIFPDVPLALQQLKETDGAVLELPYTDPWVGLAMYHQTQHERPIVGGYSSRKYPYPFAEQVPGISQLLRYDAAPLIEQDILTPSVADTALAAMDHYGVRTIVVHPLSASGKDRSLRAVLDALFGRASITPRQEGNLEIYTVPHLDYTGAIAGLGTGWHALEHDADRNWRWSESTASLLFSNAASETRRYHIELDVYAYDIPRTLIVRRDGQEVARESVGLPPGRTVTLDLELTPGDHTIELVSLEPPTTPSGDRRSLALGYSRIEIK